MKTKNSWRDDDSRADLLEQTLSEEKAADDKLSKIAVTAINVQADR